MAKAFSKNEKTRITERLFKVGLARFTRQGVRGVRIDDLCRDVGISKGSFYTFFSSKEELFMAMAQRREIQHRVDMFDLLDQPHASSQAHATAFFSMLIDKIKTDPVLNLMIEHGEIEYLLRKIPPEQMKENAQGDQIFIEQITNKWRALYPNSTVHMDSLHGLMTLMVALMMQFRLTPPQQMEQALNVLRQTFVTHLAQP